MRARVWQRVPASVDTFVGRERELAELERHLTARDSRLVTITGPGGVGKTRLGLEAARRAQGSFADGAAFVPLSALVDPRLVGDAIRESLELPAASGSGAVDVVTRGLAEAELLLVLDNFEQVLAAGPDLGAILERCPGVVALVTSRAVLKLKGEHEFPVRPLEVADEAVELFVTRARAANRAFKIDGDEAAVSELCRRLDGLPLAIEIAAGHVRLLRPRAILDRLDQVKAGEAGAGYPDRQQTLRATIEWSVALLAKPQQMAFARAGVFRSTFGLDAFESVCSPEGTHDALGLLASLVEGSL